MNEIEKFYKTIDLFMATCLMSNWMSPDFKEIIQNGQSLSAIDTTNPNRLIFMFEQTEQLQKHRDAINEGRSYPKSKDILNNRNILLDLITAVNNNIVRKGLILQPQLKEILAMFIKPKE